MPTYLINATIFKQGLRGTYIEYKKQFKVHGISEEDAREIFIKNYGFRVDSLQELEFEPPEPSEDWKQKREGFYTDLSRMREELQLLSEFRELTCEERNLICRINCNLNRLIANWQMRTMEIESGGILKC